MAGFGVMIFLRASVVVVFLFRLLEAALARSGGFSVDLIHRDSPHSPFFDSSKARTERLTDAFRRSVSRIGRFRRPTAVAPDGIQSIVVRSAGEYLMNLSIGNPPVPIVGIADTGSDLTWTQCRPCNHCYEQLLPFFDPEKSSTYRESSCGTRFCLALETERSCSKEKRCRFNYTYADGSFAVGNLASDTLTVSSSAGKPESFPGFVFGCGHSTGGEFDENSSGIVGLGGGKLSMISQLKTTIKGRFSYCLRPIFSTNTNPSRINFGTSGVVSGPGTVSTPLVRKTPDTFYHLTLEGFSVGKKRVQYKRFKFPKKKKKDEAGEGNMIVDTGTTYTYLPEKLYSELEKSVVNSIKLRKRVKDPNGIFRLCYNTSRKMEAPIITAHFKDANVELPPLNTFIRVQDDLVCFTMMPTSDIGVFGNVAQMNFLVGFDLMKKRVYFKPTDCSHSIRTVETIGWVVWLMIIICDLILHSDRYVLI